MRRQGLRTQTEDSAARGRVHADAGIRHGGMFRPAAVYGRGGDQPEIFVDDGEEIEGGLSRRYAQVVPVIAEEMGDGIPGIDHHRCGEKFFKELQIGTFAHAVVVLTGRRRRRRSRGGRRLERRYGKDRRHEFSAFSLPSVDIDFFGDGGGLEDFTVFAGRLAFAKEEITAVFQGGMKDGEHAFLQDGLEVNQHVAAADEIKTAEGRI